MAEFDGKPIRSVTQGAADLSKMPPTGETAGEATDTSALVDALKAALGDAVSDVRTTDRLVESAVVLAAGSAGPDLQMQRVLRRAGRTSYAPPPVLEINPRHALIVALASRQADGGDMAGPAGMLLDLARVQDGDLPRDPAAFARRIETALAQSFP
jgi:molecular chaperone HtpG